MLYLCASIAVGAPENRVFELEHRRADDVIAQLRDLYGNEPRLSANGQSLVVRAEPEQLAEIERLVWQIDQPLRQVQISLRQRNMASGSRRDGYSSRIYSTGRDSTRSVTVQDQQFAQISSGQITRLPVAARGGWNPAVVLKEADLSSGFLVRPTVLSEDQVELEITALHNNHLRGRLDIDTAGVTTIRRVQPGEWVELGAEQQTARTPGNGRVYSSGLNGNRLWEVQVEVLHLP